MRMWEAMHIINEEEQGFMVNFEVREGGVLRSDFFPDKHAGEKLIETEDEAWDLARKFSEKKQNAVNIYVIDQNFSPVAGYREKKLKQYRP